MITFTISDQEEKKLIKWKQQHHCKAINKQATEGGRFTYIFTPTGLGICTTVKCMCGEKINLTDTNDW